MSLKNKFFPDSAGEQTEITAIENFASGGNTRNICFVEEDGKRTFLNYAYLIAGEYQPNESVIKLSFTTHIVTLKGKNLAPLFESMSLQMTKSLRVIDKRYLNLLDADATALLQIAIFNVEK